MLSRLLKDLKARKARSEGPGERFLNDGFRDMERGNLISAELNFKAAASIQPGEQALRGLGMLYAVSGRLSDAREVLAQAVELNPGSARARSDLANVLQQMVQPDGALLQFRRALELDPDDAASWNNFGIVLWQKGNRDAARLAFRNALRSEPLSSQALRNLLSCNLLEEDERLIQGIRDAYPGYAGGAAALGCVILLRRFETRSALRELDAAIDLGLSEPGVHLNRGIALQDLGRISEALESYDRALELDPADVRARWHRSLALLLTNRFADAWDGYEERLRQDDPPVRAFPFPRWHGGALPDGTLLIYAEQGLGDELMFASCIHEALESVERCVIDCHPKLAGLFRLAFPNAQIHPGHQTDPIDWCFKHQPTAQIPLGSLPQLFRRKHTDFPEHHGYLSADPGKKAHWRRRLDGLGPGRKIGISWRGGTDRSRGNVRSIDPVRLLTLLAKEPIRFVNVQYDSDPAEVRDLSERSGVEVQHWNEALEDYEETAALVSEMDLVLTVCTAVAHLGGALGKPVWVLAPFSPEWRYGATGESMPWYPSVRVFRQTEYRQWQPLLESVARRLSGDSIGDEA